MNYINLLQKSSKNPQQINENEKNKIKVLRFLSDLHACKAKQRVKGTSLCSIFRLPIKVSQKIQCYGILYQNIEFFFHF